MGYLCPKVNAPAGGVRIIYRHAEMLSELLPKDIETKIFHFNDVNFKCDWFKHKVNFKKDNTFDPKNDFVIVPEWMAVYHAKMLQGLNVRYAIFVLNGFYLYTRPNNQFKDQDIYDAYNKAEFIISMSNET